MINRVKARLVAGEQVSDCLVKTLLETQESEKLSWEDMCFIVIAFTTGGVHSVSTSFVAQSNITDFHCQTSGIIEWFLALIPSYPHIQAKAHEELDRVIGREQWPTSEDESKLPYCRAIIKEVILASLLVPELNG